MDELKSVAGRYRLLSVAGGYTRAVAAADPDPLLRVRAARVGLERARLELVDAMSQAEDLGATQRDIGIAAGVSQGEVWKILRRGKRPR